jgi:hypothetical protein
VVTGTADARPLSDTGLVTEPAPTPVFRRFPYVQLVFCLACLTMTAWTWMRYSYAWDVTAQQLLEDLPPSSIFTSPGQVPAYSLHGDYRYDGVLVSIHGDVSSDPELHKLASSFSQEAVPIRFETLAVLVTSPRASASSCSVAAVHIGRVRPGVAAVPDCPTLLPVIDTSASRFHPASVAGLVVGMMGCFIFGLYLRGWLRERKST